MIRTSYRKATYRNHSLAGAMGSCCSSCATHQTGPPIGPAHTHTHGCGSCGGGSLGDAQCDQDGNCYDPATGVYTPAPVFDLTNAPLSANLNSAKVWLSQNASAVTALAAILGIVALASGGGKRR